eukprot:XP_014632632.1 uncharacterized protein LOC100794523 isoform X1 [Glycine max]
MVVLIEQSELTRPQAEENNDDLVLDGGFSLLKSPSHVGFTVPDINSYGHSFRNYYDESERNKSVEELYRQQHTNQTYEFTAEAARNDYPNEDWLHLTALIHDLGKVLLLPSFGGLPQWAVVGDSFPLGCAFHEANTHFKYFKDNPDSNNPAYNTKKGIYDEGCGLDNVMMSWGHDEYMYLVTKGNNTTLPSEALFIIRYHSFHPLYQTGAYKHLYSEEDVKNLKWLEIFHKYDLYSKSNVLIDVEKVKPYYMSLIKKYFPPKLIW